MNTNGRNNNPNRPESSNSLHHGECNPILDSEGKSDRVGAFVKNSKSNTNERRVGKRSLKGSLRTQP